MRVRVMQETYADEIHPESLVIRRMEDEPGSLKDVVDDINTVYAWINPRNDVFKGLNERYKVTIVIEPISS